MLDVVRDRAGMKSGFDRYVAGLLVTNVGFAVVANMGCVWQILFTIAASLCMDWTGVPAVDTAGMVEDVSSRD